jgi:hypothetical protein
MDLSKSVEGIISGHKFKIVSKCPTKTASTETNQDGIYPGCVIVKCRRELNFTGEANKVNQMVLLFTERVASLTGTEH